MPLKTWLVAALGLGSLVVLIVAVDAGLVAESAGHLRCSSIELNTTTAWSRRNRAACAPTSTCRASSCATTCSTSRASAHPSTANSSRVPPRQHDHARRTQDAHGRDEQIREPAGEARRLLGDVRSAVRLDADREDPPERDASCAGRSSRGAMRCCAIAQEIEELNNANLTAQRDGGRAAARGVSTATSIACCGRPCSSASVVAVIVVVRLRVLERRSEKAEDQMRELSQQLVSAQEEERRNLSRELHDHVAQVLTGLADGAGAHRADERRPAWPRSQRVQEARRRHVPHRSRSRARPPAEHARRLRPAGRRSNGTCRDFMRRYAIDVEIARWTATSTRCRTSTAPASTAVIQEAMTNCARHAQATTFGRRWPAEQGQLRVLGHRRRRRAGSAHRPRRGLGLRGIDERVKELRGHDDDFARRPGAGRRSPSRLPLPSPMRRWPLRVLLADDHSIVRRGLRGLLEAAGLDGRRRSGSDGLEAVAALRGTPARHRHPRHRHAETERHRSGRARAEARSAAGRDHPQRARRRVLHHACAGGRRACLPAEERDRRRSDSGGSCRRAGKALLQSGRDRRARRGLRPAAAAARPRPIPITC